MNIIGMPHTTYPVRKRICFSIDVKGASFGPIAVYFVLMEKGKVIPRDSKYFRSFPDMFSLTETVEKGAFHYYWGHVNKETREQFIIDMNDFGITVKKDKR